MSSSVGSQSPSSRRDYASAAPDEDGAVGMQTPPRRATTNDHVLPPTPDSDFSEAGVSSPAAARGSEPVVPPTPAAHNSDHDDDASMRSELTPISMLRGGSEQENEPAENAPPEQAEEEWTGSAAHIRGTDIHVPTAAATFADFLRTFVSLEHARRRQRQVNNHDDDDSSVDSLMDDDEDDTTPLYLHKLDAMIQRGTLTGTAQSRH